MINVHFLITVESNNETEDIPMTNSVITLQGATSIVWIFVIIVQINSVICHQFCNLYWYAACG